MATAQVPAPAPPAPGPRAVLAAQGVLSLLSAPLVVWTDIPVDPPWLDHHRAAAGLLAAVVGVGVLWLRRHLGAVRSSAWLGAMLLEVFALGVAGARMVQKASVQIGLGSLMAAGAVWQLLRVPGPCSGGAAERRRHDGLPRSRSHTETSIGPGGDRTGLAEPRSVPSGLSTDWLSEAGGRLAAALHGGAAFADWLGQPSVPSKAVVPDFRGMYASEVALPALRSGVRTAIVQMTEHPAPTDGVVVDQEPAPGTTVKREARVTLTVRHPEGDQR